MSIKVKVAYLEGLAKGMSIDSKEVGKLFHGIIDVLVEMADEIEKLNDEIEDLNENALDIGEELDALSGDLANVEEFLDELDVDDDDVDIDFDDDDDDDDYDDDEEYGCRFCGKSDTRFTIDVNCPECDAEIELDEEDIANESVTCPACGKLIELEIDEG